MSLVLLGMAAASQAKPEYAEKHRQLLHKKSHVHQPIKKKHLSAKHVYHKDSHANIKAHDKGRRFYNDNYHGDHKYPKHDRYGHGHKKWKKYRKWHKRHHGYHYYDHGYHHHGYKKHYKHGHGYYDRHHHKRYKGHRHPSARYWRDHHRHGYKQYKRYKKHHYYDRSGVYLRIY